MLTDSQEHLVRTRCELIVLCTGTVSQGPYTDQVRSEQIRSRPNPDKNIVSQCVCWLSPNVNLLDTDKKLLVKSIRVSPHSTLRPDTGVLSSHHLDPSPQKKNAKLHTQHRATSHVRVIPMALRQQIWFVGLRVDVH